MNGYERVDAVLRGEEPDLTPVILHNFMLATRKMRHGFIERRTMIANRYNLPGDGLFLFAEGGEVMYRDIVIRPLKN